LVQYFAFATRKARLYGDRRRGAVFQASGNPAVVEDLKRGTHKDMGPKDIFRMAFKKDSDLEGYK